MASFAKRLPLMVLDLAVSLLAVLIAFSIRFSLEERAIPAHYLTLFSQPLWVVLPVRALIYYVAGLYRQVWSLAGLPELMALFWAITVESAVTSTYIYLKAGGKFPRSVLVMGWLLTLAGIVLIRLLLRIRHDWQRPRQVDDHGAPTLIFGAGAAGAMLAREFGRHPELKARVVGFLDDDRSKQGYRIAGKPVLGTRAELPAVVREYGIVQLVIAIPSAGYSIIREILLQTRQLGVGVQTVPGIYELVDGKVSVSQIRDVQIEDLLRREEIQTDLDAIAAYLSGEVVLVTGAGGSIGSELCRQVARFSPRQLLILGHGENSIYDIDSELRMAHPHLEIIPIIADVQDQMRIQRVFERFRPAVIFHAAAHKHVPLMEYNPEEAVKNNIFGTLNVATAAHTYKVKRFVLISSDKAVNPSSAMGATKRSAELVVRAFAEQSETIFVAVRFGNVLGSRGSVVPLFKQQIQAGGPITLTDPRMVRYFMTIPEAVRLVVQAASMGLGGELFVLDMGEPVRILDLAHDLIRLSGLEPDIDIPIVFTGVRPGEKLSEELMTAAEGTATTHHDRIMMVPPAAIPVVNLEEFIGRFHRLLQSDEITAQGVKQVVEMVLREHPAQQVPDVRD